MPTLRDVQLRQRARFAQKQDALPYIRAVITDSVGNQSGSGSIWYNRDERRVWYMALGSNQPAICRCVRIEPSIGLGVIIGNIPGTPEKEVLSDDPFLRASNITGTSYVSPGPGDFEPGGRLQLWVYPKIIVPLATYPAGGMLVNTVAGDYPYNGARVTFPGATGTDLTASIPGTPGEHRLVGLYLDAANTLQTVDGTAVSTALVPPEPTWPDGAFRLCVILLTNGDTTISFDNLTDRRMVWWDIASSSPSAWPRPDKVNIGTTEYDTLALAIAAAASGDLIKVGEGTFIGEVTIPDGVDLIGSGVDITFIVDNGSSPANTLTFAGNNSAANFTIRNDTDVAGQINAGTNVFENIKEAAGGLNISGGTNTFKNCHIDGFSPDNAAATCNVYSGFINSTTIFGGTVTFYGSVTNQVTGTLADGSWYYNTDGNKVEIGQNLAGYRTQATANGPITTIATIPSDDITMPVVGTPTLDTLTDDFTTRGSSGVADGTLTYITVGSTSVKISVAAGEGYIRTSNDQQAPLVFCEWPASPDLYTFSAPAAGQETAIFVGISYNAGTPIAITSTDFTEFNGFDKFWLGRVSYDGTTMRILNSYAHAEDIANGTRIWMRRLFPFRREEAPEGTGGLELSSSLRALAMTTGAAWHGYNRYNISAIASGTAFDTHYKRAGGGFNTTIGVTSWPNTQYDDGSGTLQNLTNNRYGTLWVYLDFSDGSLDVVYGAVNAVLVSTAQADTVPTTPAHLTYHGKLIGRIIFQKSAASATLVESAWTNPFASSAVGDHTLLSNLNSASYYHLTNAEYTDLTDAGVTTLHAHSKLVAPGGSPDPALSADATGNVTGVGWGAANAWAFIVKNTSGATANAGDVGYIDSAGEYKTTTTANLNAAWCVVVSGGANNADVYVTRRGRVNVNYAGSAPSAGNYLVTSTSAGLAAAQVMAIPEIFAVCLAAGSGGTVKTLLLTGRDSKTFTSVNEILRLPATTGTIFSSTINGTPGATLVYNAPTGNEDSIATYSASELMKLVLWNTSKTPDEYALIQSTNVGTNTITPTATITGWNNGELIQVNSPNVTGTPIVGKVFYELQALDTSTIPALAVALKIAIAIVDSGAAAIQMVLHPFVAGALSTSKLQTFTTQAATVASRGYAEIELRERRICIASDASGAGTATIVLRLLGYIEAVP